MLTNCVRRMLERKVEGVAVLSFGEEEPVLDQLVHRDIPMVLAEFRLDDPKVSTILLDYSTGIRAAVDHLVELGHRQLRFWPGRANCIRPSRAKTTFARQWKRPDCRSHKNWIVECDHTLKGGVAGFERLAGAGDAPTAIVCSNDMTAIGVLRAATWKACGCPRTYRLWVWTTFSSRSSLCHR